MLTMSGADSMGIEDRLDRKEDHTSNDKHDDSEPRQIGRWREVTIPVQGHITDTTCTASIPR